MSQDNINPVRDRAPKVPDGCLRQPVSNGVKSAIEALLFISERPISLEQMKAVLDNLATTEIRKKIEQLMSEYEQANRGIRIVEVAGGFQMITAQEFAPFLKKMYKKRYTDKLSSPALQTLAIIAYKQPVTKGEIESLRNVSVDGVMKNLLDKSLIRIAGRKKAPGSPYLFGTTRQFLEYFGLKSLDELPKIEKFQSLVEDEVAERSEVIDESKTFAQEN